MPPCQHQNIYYLSLGSNISPEKHIPEVIQALKQTFTVLGVSSVYETDPVAPAGTFKFWNLAISICSDIDNTETLRSKIREIEARLGRIRSDNKFAPRTIDIDILPQPDYQKLAFVMIPLAEIAPQEKDPETGLSFLELAQGLRDQASLFRKVLF